MNTCKSLACALITSCLALAASGCGTSTRLAVENASNASIDVAVSRGSDDASFSSVAAGTTTAFKDIDWEGYDEVTVSIAGETTVVDLEEGEDNTLEVASDGTVSVEAVASSGDDNGGGW